MNGFEKRAALIKEKIMNTTLEMLGTWEPKKMRVADIAKAAGVSQVTIYNYFGSKEALLRETFKGFVENSVRDYEEFAAGKPSLKEIIEYTLIKEKEAYSILPVGTVKELMVDDPETLRYVEHHYENNVIPLIVTMVEDGKASGEISERVSVKSVLFFMQMYMRSASELLETARGQEDTNGFLEEVVHLFYYGICGREQD
ncbi:TetR/AcrR family transcriptional regulator [Paenibacillus sp. sgz500958]|uniref:TetR/AcrR family transcriptional regulator n=1 Tax=Paenibacillus sp. sgz500958 TaxID=3242475 RepID=UPI0036D2E031